MSTTAKARTARRATSNRPPRSTARPGRGTSAKAVPQSRLVLAVRRSHLLFLVAAALTGLAVAGVRLVQTDARADLLIDPSSSAYADQQLYANTFGADPVVVVLQPQPGQQLLTPQHMTAFATLEGKLAAVHGVKRVYGPGTLVNTLAVEITRRGIETCATQAHGSEQQAIQQAAAAGKSQADQNAAGQAAFDAAARSCAQDFAKQYPNMGIPAVNNPAFYSEVLLEPGNNASRPFWKWALPDPNHAVITVRMQPDASVTDVQKVLDTVNDPHNRADLVGLDIKASGTPALTAALASSVRNSLIFLLPLTLLAMLVVTLVVIKVPFRVVAIPLAVIAGLWTAGVAGLVKLPLTPATLAVLPVVLGLATDYAIQTANRVAEEEGTAYERVAKAASVILPATAVAALATAAGVLAFAISPIPLVRQFAFFMAIGVAMAFLASLLVGLPALALALRPDVRARVRGLFMRAVRTRSVGAQHAPRVAAPSWPRLSAAGRAPMAVVIPLIVIGVVGWAALPFLKVETDPTRLMPAGRQEVTDAAQVQQELGLAGEIDLVVTGGDVSDPKVVAWMDTVDKQAQSDSGGQLQSLSTLPAFLSAFNNNQAPDPSLTAQILKNIPPYFTQAVISSDRKVGRAVFGVTRMNSVEQDQSLVRTLDGLSPPPAGYRVFPAGLAVLASDALEQLTADELKLNLLALALVLAVLVLAYRHPLPAVLAVVPTAVAAGWATGLLYLLGGRSSPITILLAGVVVAFATEFSVLWLSRYRLGRREGLGAVQASEAASSRVGPAIVASAAALALGFLALAVSPVPMVRDFGLWSGADIALATAAVLVLLPPLARKFL